MNKKIILWYLLVFIFIFFGFRFTCQDYLYGLDPSWSYTLNTLHLNGDYIFGKDVFFTYGPFGYLLVPFCFKEIIWQVLLFKILVIACFIFSLFCFKDRKNANIFLGLIVFNFVCFGYELYEFLAVILAFVCLYQKNIRQYAGVILLNFLAFFMLFAKFNIGVICIATLIFTLIALRLKKEFVLLSFCIWFISLGLITYLYFGDVGTFIEWLKMSLLISSGYSETMVVWGDWTNKIYLLSAFLILVLYFILWLNDYRNKNKNFNVFFVILPSLFFVFKSGFVRADNHVMMFFVYILAIVPLLYFFVKNISVKFLLIMYCLALIYPLQHISFGMVLSFIPKLKEQDKILILNEYILPSDWINLVGNSKVEILPYELSYIPKNNLTPHYNPFLQLYTVYTKELDLASAQNYKQQNTDYIIIECYGSIDGRNLLFDNPATWSAIKENYKVIDFKQNKLLLAKREFPLVYKYSSYRKELHNVNETIQVPYDAKKVVINLDLSLFGRLVIFLFKNFTPYIYVQYNNSDIIKIRYVRDVMKNGFYIDNLVLSMNDFYNWLNDRPVENDIKSFRIYTSLPCMYKKNFSVEWQK